MDFRKRITPTFSYYCCSVKVLLVIKIRLKPSCRISASFVALLFEKESPKSYSEGLRAVFFCRFEVVVFECQVNMIKSFEKGGVFVLIATFVALDRLRVRRTMQANQWSVDVVRCHQHVVSRHRASLQASELRNQGLRSAFVSLPPPPEVSSGRSTPRISVLSL